MENKQLQVVKFQAEGKTYPITIYDAEGNRWATSQEVGEALGNTRIRKLVSGLIQSGEMIEGKHFRHITWHMPGDTQPRKYLMLSYRGIIRAGMRSEGKRALAFRDWAEDVLYEVMVTGCYLEGGTAAMPIALVEERARAEGVRRGLGFQMLRERYDLATEDLVNYLWYRYVGHTQDEITLLTGLTKDKMQAIGRMLDDLGIQLPDVITGNKLAKIKQRLFYRMLGIGSVEDDFLPIYQEAVNG